MLYLDITRRAADWSWEEWVVYEDDGKKRLRRFVGTRDECLKVHEEWAEEEQMNLVSACAV
jgi:hypothetical protein